MLVEESPHISASQLAMFTRCGEQYRRRYIGGEILPPGVGLIRGKSVHKAREVNLRQKKTTRQDLPVEAVLQEARDAVADGFAGEVVLEEDVTISAAKGQTIDAAVRLARCDYDHFQRAIQPTSVEEKVVISVPGLGRDIVGYLDCADDAGVIHDLKTAAKSPAVGAADTSDQLSVYALLYKTVNQAMPQAVELDYVVDLKAGAKPVRLVSHRDEQDLDIVLARCYTAIQGIDKGLFLPAASDAWVCDPKWCGYYSTCPYVRRNTRPTN